MKTFSVTAIFLDRDNNPVKTGEIRVRAETVEEARTGFSQGLFDKGEGNDDYQAQFDLDQVQQITDYK